MPQSWEERIRPALVPVERFAKSPTELGLFRGDVGVGRHVGHRGHGQQEPGAQQQRDTRQDQQDTGGI